MTPTISNAGKTRFLFGTFSNVSDTPVFQGAVVFGSDFTYDMATSLPTGGTVARIEVQTRSAVEVLTIHATYPDINTDVADLNLAFADAHAPWFDATETFATIEHDEDAPLDLNVKLDRAQMDDLILGKTPLQLKTGEVLSAQELSGIFADESTQLRKKQRAKAKRRNAQRKAQNANVFALNATFENAATSNFSDLDIEALENELRIGAL